MESESGNCNHVKLQSRGPPPPVPSAPPSVGRVLALKYYKKVSKSLTKGFKRPSTTTSTSSSTTSSEHSNNTVEYFQDVKIQIKIPPTETNLDELEIELESHYDHPRKSKPTSICTAISELFDKNEASAFYENMEFDTKEPAEVQTLQLELKPGNEENLDSEIIAPQPQPVGCGSSSEMAEEPAKNDDDEEEDEDSSKWDISAGECDSSCNNTNSKSSEGSSSICSNPSNKVIDPSHVSAVQRPPPPVPKFPSSTESSAEDTSFASATSGDGEGIPTDITCSISKDDLPDVNKNNEEDDDEDEVTDIPDDNLNNSTEQEELETDEDDRVKREEYEDLVEAVTQTLTLTLNNASNSLMVSLPLSINDRNLTRPETGPGDEELGLDDDTDDDLVHEYQNVFVRHGKMSRSLSQPQEESNNLKKGSPKVRSVILSESGVTTIDQNDTGTEGFDDDGSVPVVHAIINLPPRMMNLIKQRRRKTSGDLSYQKASRLSRLMVADFKAAGIDRPEGSGKSDGITDSTKGMAGKARCRLSSKVSTNVEKVGKSVSTMKRKVGSWYQRRVKTPVEQLSSDLGLDGIKFPGGGSNSNSKSKVNEDSVSNSGSRSSRPKSRAKSVVIPEQDQLQLDDESDYSVIAGDVSISTDLLYEDGKDDYCGQRKRGQNEFEDLRRLVKSGGDFCKDLSTVLYERSELESQYAKGLSKLSAKLLKASKEATGSVAHAWQAVAVQIDTQAELHRQWSTALSEELARPLRTSTDTQHKIRKSVEVLVEKTTRNLADWRTAEAKAKRQCFSSSKEFEKIQESACTILGNNNGSNQNNANSNNGINNVNNSNSNSTSVLSEVRSRSRLLSVPPLDKDPMKLEAKRRKAEEAVRRADIEYYTFCVRSERARLEWEGAIRNGSTCLRTLEEEKLSLLRDLAVKYFQNLNDFAPKLVLSVESLDEPVKVCSVGQDMHSIVDIRRHVGAEQLLPDFYAEDTSNLMKRERRHEALQKFLYLIKQDLEREKKGATGVETLAKAIAEGPKIVDNTHHDISDKLYYMRSMLLYLEASRCKVDNTIADVEGRQRSNNPITQYMRHQRDKQGFPQTILKVPSWARDDCLAYSSGGGSAGSSSPDWHDRGKADGTSGQHDTDFDEFESEGSSNENIEVFGEGEGEEDPKVQIQNSNLISVPSVGKCRAIYDYDANLFDELTIRIGDEINIHDKQEDGWWLGELKGVIGIFPATYVEEVPLGPSPTSD